MSDGRKGAFGRMFGRDPDVEDESVSISGDDDHAWWAERSRLSRAPTVDAAEAEAEAEADESPPAGTDEPDDSGPYEWTTESLFRDAPPPAAAAVADPGPMHDDGATITTAVLVDDLDEARLVLGISRDATFDEVTAAHRVLAKQYHPDRLTNLSPDAQRLGEHRMAEVNRAYDTLRTTFA